MEHFIEEAVTYDLRVDPTWTTSIGNLADEFIVEGIRFCTELLAAYYRWDAEAARGPCNTETMLEALTSGVLWNVYSKCSLVNGHSLQGPACDMEFSHLMLPDAEVLPAYGHLLATLYETGEFEEEVRRMHRFLRFFQSLPPAKVWEFVSAMSNFGQWFQVRSREILGDVTAPVEEFCKRAREQDGQRQDAALRGRHEVEYHLNLLTAVILNCAWHDRFTASEKKLLILPGCMRRRGANGCQALKTRLGLACTGCDEDCSVYRASICAAAYNVSTVVITHGSAVFAKDRVGAIKEEGYAVIGVACALSLQAGGWQAQDAGIPAQCLPLNFAGCKRHWVDKEQDMPTEIDLEVLCRIFEEHNLVSSW
jgi:hypothetical protein